jgi:hypothetical protein
MTGKAGMTRQSIKIKAILLPMGFDQTRPDCAMMRALMDLARGHRSP